MTAQVEIEMGAIDRIMLNCHPSYDTTSDTWRIGADLPIRTDHAWAVSYAGLVYVGGGASRRVFSSDPATDVWTELVPSVFQHGGTPAAAAIDGIIYVAGGSGGGMRGNELEAYVIERPAPDHPDPIPLRFNRR